MLIDDDECFAVIRYLASLQPRRDRIAAEHQRGSFTVAELICHLIGGQQCAEGYDRSARVISPEIGDGERRTIGHHDRNLLAWLKTMFEQCPGKTLDTLFELAIGEPLAVVDGSHCLRLELGSPREEAGKVGLHQDT